MMMREFFKLNFIKIMPNLKKNFSKIHVKNCFLISAFSLAFLKQGYGQDMLGFSDFHGNFYVYDMDRTVHLEHQQINQMQFKKNSLAYLNNTGDLKYYKNHKLVDLEITNPRFFMNTDNYLYYSIGYNFSVYNGIKKEQLGILQNHPYAFSDSIAGIHDFSGYLFAYWKNQFIQLEPLPAQAMSAGDNILCYITNQNECKVFWHNKTYLLDQYKPYAMQCGENTCTFIDNFKYLKIFWNGEVYEMYYVPEIFCSSENGNNLLVDENYCDAFIMTDENSSIPLFKTGDNLVAFINDEGSFILFQDGTIQELDTTIPKDYQVTDNICWWIDQNNFFHIFYQGEDQIAEYYIPKKISSDKDIVSYIDNDGKLKAYYRGESIKITQSIILDYQLNNSILMYSILPNKYEFFKLK